MPLSHRVVVSLALLVSALAPAIGHAQNENDARHHFRLGQAHYESGAFVEAAREFEESFRLSGRTELLHNIYVAYRDAGELERAADALRRYLAGAQNIENEPMLRQRLAALERRIAQQGGGETAPPPGGGETTPRPREGGETTPPPPAHPTTPSPGPSFSPVGFVVAGAGGLLAIVGAITGGVALSMEGDIATSCPNQVCPDQASLDKASTGYALALTTDILIPVGLVAAAAGIVLLFVLPGSESARAGAACGPDGCFAAVRGRF